jgi:anti-sigma-K factor RskA
MIDERHEELAALHAFGLLEGAERAEFIAAMEASPELRRLVAELTLAATGLAHGAPDSPPPAELRARVLASAAGRAPGAPAARSPAEVISLRTWIPWLAAAALGVAALWYGRQFREARVENGRLRADALSALAALHQSQSQLEAERATAMHSLEAAQAELVRAKQMVTDASRRVAELSTQLKDQGDLAKLKIATLASMLGNSPAAVAVAVWDPSRDQGVLSVTKLPVAAAEKDYQLWVIDKRYPTPVSAGTFVVDPVTGEAHVVFRADKPVNAIAKFAVTLERKGGVPSPQGPIVLISP